MIKKYCFIRMKKVFLINIKKKKNQKHDNNN